MCVDLANNEIFWSTVVASMAYFLKSFIFDQILEYKKIKGRIRNRLKYYENVICNSGIRKDLVMEAHIEIRQLSCDLEEKYFAIFSLVRLPIIRLAFCLPSKKDIDEAVSRLIYLSNSTDCKISEIDRNHKTVVKIRTLLDIKKS